MKAMLVSIIIPAYNEEKNIDSCLKSLLKQEISDDVEVIVIDNASKDKTAEIVSGYVDKYPGKIFLVRSDKNLGPGGARNLGAKIARGEILVFLDADMIFPSDFLKKLIEPLKRGMATATVYSDEYVANVDNPWVKVQGQYKRITNIARSGEVFRAIMKNYFLEHGGFDPSLRYHDDRTFHYKTGLRALVVENTYCYHNNPDSPREIFRRNFWIGRTLIAVSLIERGWKGLIEVCKIILLRIIDLAAIPSFLYGILRILDGVDIFDIILIMPFALFTAMTLRSRLVNVSSNLEKLALKIIYAPAYRVVRAAGLIAGILFSSRAKIERQ